MAKTFGDLGLRPGELRVIRMCLWALTQVENGHYLCAPHQIASAQRLVAKGFLTNATGAQGFVPPVRGDGSDGWYVVKLTEENMETMRKEAPKE